MASLVNRLRCFIGRHDYHWTRVDPYPPYRKYVRCARCGQGVWR